MNWIKNVVRPRIKTDVQDILNVPNNLWSRCPSCDNMLFHRDLEANLNVCNNCGYHLFFPAIKRLELILDDGAIDVEMPSGLGDPLKFKDKEKYKDKLEKAVKKSYNKDAIITRYGTIKGVKAVVSAFDFSFMGGSMGTGVGEGIVQAIEYALAKKSSFVIVPASGGARMHEGIFSLMQMARTTVAVQKLKEAGLPFIVVLTNPTTGGVTASFAMLGDIHIAEKGAVIGFAGERVIKQTIRQDLPKGFQRSEYLYDHGMVDIVVTRHELKDKLANILGILTHSSTK